MPQVFYVQNISSSSIYQIVPTGASLMLDKQGLHSDFPELEAILSYESQLKNNPSALVKGGYVQVSADDFTDRLKAYDEFIKRQTLINR